MVVAIQGSVSCIELLALFAQAPAPPAAPAAVEPKESEPARRISTAKSRLDQLSDGVGAVEAAEESDRRGEVARGSCESKTLLHHTWANHCGAATTDGEGF